ncbi:SCO3242 family prenyltransferase [Streptomyces winkii]|uniref:SCO3242 family prenyltransferase n=1 Tax=Streptomyces winkii TaxID=3051178 RepID=UPI0028D6F2BE|nr:UbiA family prenyltransferase [Streptomyces sp. DSM 40971]
MRGGHTAGERPSDEHLRDGRLADGPPGATRRGAAGSGEVAVEGAVERAVEGPFDEPADEGPERADGAAARAAAWAELLRVSALFTVPGDAVAGAAASGHRPNRGTVLAAGASLCLYEAGMALNDYADRHIDAVERPGRPVPSGRIRPGHALAVSAVLTVAGLGLAAAAGGTALATGTALAGAVWAYDMRLKHTALGPAAMAAARGLDLVLGAVATTAVATGTPVPCTGPGPAGPAPSASRIRALSGSVRPGPAPAARATPGEPASGIGEVLRAAGLLGLHTFAVTTVSRREALGGTSVVPLAALGAVGAVAAALGRSRPPGRTPGRGGVSAPGRGPVRSPGRTPERGPLRAPRHSGSAVPVRRAPGRRAPVRRAPAGLRTSEPVGFPAPAASRAPAVLAAAAYAVTAARPLVHAVLNPSPPLLQRAVGGGIRATIPLQAALNARAGRPCSGAAVLSLLPSAVRLSRKVSPT